MAAIRITIGDMPRLLRSLVEGTLTEDPRFELARDDAPADVLLVSEGTVGQLLAHPAVWQAQDGLGIVAIAPDGGSAAVLRVSADRKSLDGDPRQMLAQAVLAAAGMPAETG